VSDLRTEPCSSDVTLTISGPLTHLCPFVEEVDNGTVQITWRTRGQTLELHALRAWLDTFQDQKISHEALTDAIRRRLTQLPGIGDVRVTTRWHTAGFVVAAQRGAA